MTTIEKHSARRFLFYTDIVHVIYYVYCWYTLGDALSYAGNQTELSFNDHFIIY